MFRLLFATTLTLCLGFPSFVGAQTCSGDATLLLYPLDATYTLVDFCGDGPTGNRPAVCPDQHNDDDSAVLTLPFSFDLYGQIFTTVFINNNGTLSFGQEYATFTREAFPVVGFPMVAPFWADVDTGSASNPIGDVWMKIFDSNGDSVDDTLVVTWDNVGSYNQNDTLRNTFQVALSDGSNPMIGLGNNVCFSYDEMCWTTGTASGGAGGFGGTPATVGANHGNGVDFFQVGLFNATGSAYDGPGGAFDGVDYLDGQTFCFSTATTLTNLAPIATFTGSGDIVVNANDPSDTLATTVSFMSPELLQTTTVAITDLNGALGAGLSITNTAGNLATVELNWAPSCSAVGTYSLELEASDNFNPTATTTVPLTIRVICEDPCGWSDVFQTQGIADTVRALTEFDAGGGTALYVAGDFVSPGSHIASWDGTTWSSLGTGLDGAVHTLTVFDDGTGPALYAGGDFSTAGAGAAAGVARWNGTSWTALGAGLPGGVSSLATFDDGAGTALYAAGGFNLGTGAPADYVARWDGTTWVALGTGVDGPVHALTTFDPGSGTQLYAGGAFLNAGGSPAASVASWDGAAWNAVGTGTDGVVWALESYDDGTGADLIVGGDYQNAGGAAANNIAAWSGATWTALGAGTDGPIYALETFSVLGISTLFAGGEFYRAGVETAQNVARWDGAWTDAGVGVANGLFESAAVYALSSHTNLRGPAVFVGGDFDTAGGFGNTSLHIARWTDVDPLIFDLTADQDLCEGDLLELAVDVAGAPPLAYQWRKDGVDLPGATASTYSVASALVADSGTYEVLVSNTCGAEVSTSIVIFVEAEPLITSDPLSETICLGLATQLSVSATGLGTLTYQWRLDGIDIPGANSNTYDLPIVSLADAGSYDVIVTDDCGSSVSATAVLNVLTPPTLTSVPTSQDVCEGTATVLSATATGTAPLSYQWSLNGLAIPGATSPTYSIAAMTQGDEGAYTVNVSNVCGNVESADATVTFLGLPEITQSPMSQTVCPQTNVTFQVVATGAAPLSYQWRRGGVAIPGETTNTLVLTGVTAADAGVYDVAVSNSCDTAISAPATLTILASPTLTSFPSNQSVCEGTSTTLTVSASGTAPLSYQWSLNGVPIPGATTSSFTILSMSAVDAGAYVATVSNVCGTIDSPAALLTYLAPPVVTLNPTSQTVCPGTDVTLSVNAGGASPLSYQWRRNGVDLAGATATTLILPGVTSADAGSYDVVVSNSCDVVTTTPALLEVLEVPTITLDPSSMTICESSMVTFSMAASGSAPLTIQWRKDGTPIAGATSTSYVINSATAADAGSYDAVVTNSCGQATTASALLTVNVFPTFTLQPVAQSLTVGDSATFNVATAGTAPINIQWFKDGAPIAGATSSTLIIDPVVSPDAGTYYAEATNVCGAVASDTVSLTVAPVTPPTNLACCAADLDVSLSWSNALAYESVRVYRDSLLIATLPAGTTAYQDSAAGVGSYTYDVEGVIAGEPSLPTSCVETAIAAPESLQCVVLNPTFLSPTVEISWTLPAGYDFVEVYRDGALLVIFPASQNVFTESGGLVGTYDYEIRAKVEDTDCDATASVFCSLFVPQQSGFRRGDSNNDGQFNIADVVFIISYLFTQGEEPACLDAADANDDSGLDISDPVYLSTYFFVGGPPPPPPFTMTDQDPTDDLLGCEASTWAP